MTEDLLRLNPDIWCRRFLAKSTVLNYSFKPYCKVHSVIGGYYLYSMSKVTTSAEAALLARNRKKQKTKHLKRTVTTFAKEITISRLRDDFNS